MIDHVKEIEDLHSRIKDLETQKEYFVDALEQAQQRLSDYRNDVDVWMEEREEVRRTIRRAISFARLAQTVLQNPCADKQSLVEEVIETQLKILEEA